MFLVLLLSLLLLFLMSWDPFLIRKNKLSPSKITLIYGAPGSGKTTYAAKITHDYLSQGVPVYSNVPIKGAFILTKDDLGKFNIPFGVVILDEIGTIYNNRDFSRNFVTKKGESESSSLRWFKQHRHEGVEIYAFSQAFDDVDKKIFNLATEFYICKKSIFHNFVSLRRMHTWPDIDEEKHKPDDFYDFAFLGRHWFYAPKYWPMFDSFERMGLPAKGWIFYGGFPDGQDITPIIPSMETGEASSGSY